MSWFFVALIAPFLWAICNFIDKVLIEKYISRADSVVVLILYSMLFSAFVFPVVYLVDPEVLSANVLNVLLLMIAGVIEMAAVALYLRALVDDDASTVVPFFQTVPVFSLFLGFAVLGEVLAPYQIVAGAVAILGGMLLSIEFAEEKRVRFKWSLLGLMLLSSFGYALFDALFKFGALKESFWTAIFWQHAGIALAGLALFVFARRYRTQFLNNFRKNGARIVSLNMANELLYTIGIMVLSFALLLAPIALVATANIYHPVFVFVIGLFFTLFLPRLLSENLSLRHFLIKITAIMVIFLASGYLVQS